MEALATPRSVQWCDWEGNPVGWAGLLPSIEMVSQCIVSLPLISVKVFLSFGGEHLLKFPVYPGLVIPVSSSVSHWLNFASHILFR